MAVTETTKKVSVSMKLNNGVDSQGNVKTVSVSLGSLNPEGYDNDKAMNIIKVLRDCFSLSYYGTDKTTTGALVNA